ncbi:hypothetical protein [Marinomonas epiphytica]
MGILMAVLMVVILLLSVPSPLRGWVRKWQGILAAAAFLGGVWNFFWYGAQHIGELWGNASLVSGLLMMLTSLPLLKTELLPSFLQKLTSKAQHKTRCFPQGLYELCLVILFVFFCLYTYNLLKLNMVH